MSLAAVYWQPISNLTSCVLRHQGMPALQSCILTDAYSFSFSIMLFLGLFCFLLTRLTGNDSWVDRTWSIIPVVYAWLFALWKNPLLSEAQHFSTKPGDAAVKPLPLAPSIPWTARVEVALVITIWGVRLTYNFWRRGGYSSGGEDHRWEVIRAWKIWKSLPLLWYVFSFFFISVYQQLLLWLIVVPMYLIPVQRQVTVVEHSFALMFLVICVIETIADQQQWNFQNEKRKLKPQRKYLEEDYQQGFLTHGLFSRSRHPNVWAEQQMWLVTFGSSMVYTGGANWSCMGCLLLTMLTIGSSHFTENISKSKYPMYRIYQQHIPMLVPKFFGTRKVMDDHFKGIPPPGTKEAKRPVSSAGVKKPMPAKDETSKTK